MPVCTPVSSGAGSAIKKPWTLLNFQAADAKTFRGSHAPRIGIRKYSIRNIERNQPGLAKNDPHARPKSAKTIATEPARKSVDGSEDSGTELVSERLRLLNSR